MYYLTRSQPPLLADMVAAVYNVTRDASFLQDSLPILEREHTYWSRSGEYHISGVTHRKRCPVTVSFWLNTIPFWLNTWHGHLEGLSGNNININCCGRRNDASYSTLTQLRLSARLLPAAVM